MIMQMYPLLLSLALRGPSHALLAPVVVSTRLRPTGCLAVRHEREAMEALQEDAKIIRMRRLRPRRCRG